MGELSCLRCGEAMTEGQKYCCPRQCLNCKEDLPLGSNNEYCSYICGIEYRARGGEQRHCHICGRVLVANQRKYCRQCASKSRYKRLQRSRAGMPVARPKDDVVWHGSVMVWDPEHPRANNGRIRRCIRVVEDVIGRRLEKSEAVLHMDANRRNDDADNLLVVHRSQLKTFRLAMLDATHKFMFQKDLVDSWREFIKREVYGEELKKHG